MRRFPAISRTSARRRHGVRMRACGARVRVGGRVAMIRYHFSAHGGNNQIRMRLLVDGDEKEEARSVNQQPRVIIILFSVWREIFTLRNEMLQLL